MRWEGVLLAVVLSVVLTWSNSHPSSDAEDKCSAVRERWGRALTALEDRSNAYDQAKAQSLEPEIRAGMTKMKGSTTVARIVRDALTDHERKLAESRTELIEVAKQEERCFAEWRACVSRMARRNRKADLVALATAGKQRKKMYRQIDLLLLDPAYIQYKNSRPRRVPDNSGYDPYWR